MKLPYFLFCFLLTCFSGYAQKQDSTRLFVPKNTIHWEAAGNNTSFFSTHYNRIIRQYSESRYLGYGIGISFMPYHKGIVAINQARGSSSSFTMFKETDWKRYNFTFSPYLFHIRRIKQSRSFLEFSAGYVLRYYYRNYVEMFSGTFSNVGIDHERRTMDHNLLIGIGIRRQTTKGLFFRFYLLSHYELYRTWFGSIITNGGGTLLLDNRNRSINLGLGIGIGKSFGK